MKPQEAIKSMNNIIEYWTYKPTEVEAAKTAIAALEKQIAKKPIIVAFVNDEDALFECRCGTAPQFRYKQHKYCPECGRKLDWSEEL